MPATNYTPIQLYRSTTSGNVPSAANLSAGEIALNIADNDMTMYMENASGVVKSFFNNPAALKYPTADGTSGQVLQTNGAGVLSFGAAGGGANIQSFPASGTYTKPTGAKFVMVELWGAGGGGGAAIVPSNGAGAFGGGGGGYTTRLFAAPDVGATETVTVGAGGAGGASPTPPAGPGVNGGTTNFGTLLYAFGGLKGGSQFGTGGQGGGGGAIFPGVNLRGLFGAKGPTGIQGALSMAVVEAGCLDPCNRNAFWRGGSGGSPGPIGGGFGGLSLFGGGGGGAGQSYGSPFCCCQTQPSPSPINGATGGAGRAYGKGSAQGPLAGPACVPATPNGSGGGGPRGSAGNAFNGGGGGSADPSPGAGGAGGLAGGGGGAGGGRYNSGGPGVRGPGGAGGNGYAVVYSW